MNIRNFCIIAHIDHGKSTLADRLLEKTHTVSPYKMREQLLDQMDLERERGITIKLQPVRMDYVLNDQSYVLNLIDTPGHVDFTYEVSRSLAAVEGALLLVDATQGVQAQTLANLYLAMEQNLTIIPVMNKIDLPGARIEEVRDEITHLLGCHPEEVLAVSAKSGEGIPELIEYIIHKIPPPIVNIQKPFRALIFDSVYDTYRGVVAYVRVFDGSLKSQTPLTLYASKAHAQSLEVGVFRPQYEEVGSLTSGEIGYIVTGLRSVRDCRVGDTVCFTSHRDEIIPLSGYKEIKPVVFAGMFCRSGDEFAQLRDAIEKLKLNDAAFSFTPEHSPALGFGFRCGFLGLLHLEIIQERLKREFHLDVIVTVPSVQYRITSRSGEISFIRNPLEFPEGSHTFTVEEPVCTLDVITPEPTLGALMSYVLEKRGTYINTEYLGGGNEHDTRRVLLHFELPLATLLVDFYDALKSISSGYASMNYEMKGYKKTDVERMDIFVGGKRVDELSTIVYTENSYYVGKKIVESLKTAIPRQQFEIKLQAAIGSTIIASERIAPFRKDVTAKLYGGDVTRKQKLLEKQKKGKKKMKDQGRVEIPSEAYLKILRK